MSLPHTGNLDAKVKGVICHFDGDKWTTDDAELSGILNDATDNSPKTHFSIQELV